MNKRKHKAVVLLGPTASGKSDLALQLARSYVDSPQTNLEIIAADSMQVYKQMNIGTAKPTLAEQAEIPHHCLDLVEPFEEFSVDIYQKLVKEILDDMNDPQNQKSASRHALIVGGTGLYIRAVVDDLKIPARYPEIAVELDNETATPALWERLHKLDPKAAETMLPNNRRRILRALEVTLGSGKQFSSFGAGLTAYEETDFLQVGIRLSREVLDARIDKRYEIQMEAGFLEEVRSLSKLSLSKTARQALGYKELLAHLEGEMSLEDALDEAKRRTKRFARRQERWFRRDPRIHWIDMDGGIDMDVGTQKRALLHLRELINSNFPTDAP